jgi:hypothetical protein
LFVPRIVAIGNPGKRMSIAGSWMRPPPPTTESMYPASNEKAQMRTMSMVDRALRRAMAI